MYRKLIAVPLLAFTGAAAYQLFQRLSWQSHLGGDEMRYVIPGWGSPIAAIPAVWFVAIALALCWAVAFHPGRPYPAWQRALKYVAAACGFGLAAVVLNSRGALAGDTAFVLLRQTHATPAEGLLASFLLGTLPEALALSLFLAAPVYWLVRGVQVRSLPRATFEAWVEAERLILPGILLLIAGAILNRWAGPSLTTWILR